MAEPTTAIAPVQAHIEQRSNGGAIAAFSSQGSFEAAQRMAKALASSSLVPEAYRGNIPNCLIAMELASRIGVSVFAAMQNMDIIHGRPSWRAQFLIATVNGSGRFTPIRFRFEGKQGTDAWSCTAVAADRESGELCEGPSVSIGMAKAEGWYGRNGSKWKTLPQLMLSYRAAAFWTRLFAPELSLGMHTSEEAEESRAPMQSLPSSVVTGSIEALEAQLADATPLPVEPAETEPDAPTTQPPAEPALEPGEER